jgi:REP element-mobilizing transposase RayT
MARLKRLYFDGAVYHVYLRGNNREAVLKEGADKISFLQSIDKFRDRLSFKVYAYVLMDNHAHMVIETVRRHTISRVIQSIALSYSRKYRAKHKRCGYVWQGRFKSKVITGERYILECINYIHNNPVRAKIVDSPGDYPWSSYGYYSPKKQTKVLLPIDSLGDGDSSAITTSKASGYLETV